MLKKLNKSIVKKKINKKNSRKVIVAQQKKIQEYKQILKISKLFPDISESLSIT